MSKKYTINPHTNKPDRITSDDEVAEFLNVYSSLKESVDALNDLPLTGNTEGDMRVTLDTDKIYIWSISSSSGTIDDWLLIGATTSISWGQVIGTLSNQIDLQSALDTKANTSHTPHSISDVTNLQTTLDDKADKIPQPNSGETVLLLDMETPFADRAENHIVSLEDNGQLNTNAPKFGNSSLGGLGGSSPQGRAQVPFSSDFDFFAPGNTEDFTMEFWAKQNSTQTGIYASCGSAGSRSWTIKQFSSDYVQFQLWDFGQGLVLLELEIAFFGFTAGVWYHIAVIRQNGNLGIYFNGNQADYLAKASVPSISIGPYPPGGAQYLRVGTNVNNTGGHNGQIDHFRISYGNPYNANPNSGDTDTITVPTIAPPVLERYNLAGIEVGTEDLIVNNSISEKEIENHINSNKGIELDTDPTDPDIGKYVIWQSTGVGSGNAGDIMIKINDGGVTTTYKLLDINKSTENIIVENTDIDVGTEVVDSFSDTLTDSVVWYYRVKEGSNFRAGKIRAVWDESTNTINFTEVSTQDIGDTSALTFAVVINSDNVELQAILASGSNYEVRTLRNIL